MGVVLGGISTYVEMLEFGLMRLLVLNLSRD
jgi:hypothetical protein